MLLIFQIWSSLHFRSWLKKTEEGFEPSEVAKEYQDQFREIMIDEYQDSNLIQETILTSISGVSKGKYNSFYGGRCQAEYL